MADILSQAEIDALLNSMGSGEAPPEEAPQSKQSEAHNYDFRTANRFSREHIRTFNVIYDTFSRLFTTYLSGTLRVMCACDVVSVEEVKYQEFVNAMPSSVVLAILRMPPLTGPTLLEMAPDLAYVMITRLLGGSSASGVLEISRNFTEIELACLERLIKQFISLVAEAWEKIVEVNPQFERIETSPQFAQIVALNETVALITINVKIGGNEGLMYFCLPQLALQPISKQLSTKFMFQGTDRDYDPARAGTLQRRIENTPLPVRAVFNDTPASVREILSLQVGDVLQLDHSVHDELTLKVGHLSKFKGTIGIKDNRYAVKVSEILRDEEENEK